MRDVDWRLWPVLFAGLVLRIVFRGTGDSAFGDSAFLVVWSRRVAEAGSLGLSSALALARSGETAASGALADSTSLAYAVLSGLYENPEKITRLLDVFALAGWFRISGYSPWAAELLMILVTSATIAAVYALTWIIWKDRAIALVSAIIVAAAPGFLANGRLVSWHIFGQLTFVIAVAAGLRAYERRNVNPTWRGLVAAGLIWGISLYSNSLLPMLVPAVLLPVFLFSREGAGAPSFETRVKALAVYVASGLVLFMPAIAVIALRWDRFVEKNISVYATSYYEGADLMGKTVTLLDTWAANMTVPLVAAAAVGLWVAIRRQGNALALPAWITAYFLFSLVFGEPELQQRAVLVSLPALAILAAVGLTTAWRAVESSIGARPSIYGVVRTGLAAALGGLLLIPSQAAIHARENRTAERAAVEGLLRTLDRGEVVVTNIPDTVHVLVPDSQAHVVIHSESLLRRSSSASAARDYVRWRYPGREWPAARVSVLLSLRRGLEVDANAVHAASMLVDSPCAYTIESHMHLRFYRCS